MLLLLLPPPPPRFDVVVIVPVGIPVDVVVDVDDDVDDNNDMPIVFVLADMVPIPPMEIGLFEWWCWVRYNPPVEAGDFSPTPPIPMRVEYPWWDDDDDDDDILLLL